jgi:hypothetical protein
MSFYILTSINTFTQIFEPFPHKVKGNHCQNSLVQDKMMMASANVNKAVDGINVGDRTPRLQQ